METGDSVWWDESWNPVLGCKPVGPGCRNCYAAKAAGTLLQQSGRKRQIAPLYRGIVDEVNGNYVFNGHLTAAEADDDLWSWPSRWKGAEVPVMGPGKPSLIFVVDMGDLFFETRPTALIDRVIGEIARSHHVGLLLSRRPAWMAKYFTDPRWSPSTLKRWKTKLWLGFSAERQREFDQAWSHMRELARADWTVFTSLAPLISPVTLPDDFLALGERGWVIVSGEQGPSANCRDLDRDWPRAPVRQCRSAKLPVFTKQMARKAPIDPDVWERQFPAVRQE